MRRMLLCLLLASSSAFGSDTPRQKFPYVVPYPDITKPSVVARQFESNGTYTDLHESGKLTVHNVDGGLIAKSGGCGAKCRARQGLPPDPNLRLALWYKKTYSSELSALRVTRNESQHEPDSTARSDRSPDRREQ